MKKLLMWAVVAILTLTLIPVACGKKEKPAAQEEFETVNPDTMENQLVDYSNGNAESSQPVQPSGQSNNKPEVNKWDSFLDEYERTVVAWENKTKDGKLSVSDLAILAAQNIELGKKANDADFKKTATPEQLQRAADLTARMTKLTQKK